MEIEHAFGKVLKEKRLANQLSQEKLALLCELDRTYIGLIERGQRQPTITTLFKLAYNLKTTPSEFIENVDLYYNNKKKQ